MYTGGCDLQVSNQAFDFYSITGLRLVQIFNA